MKVKIISYTVLFALGIYFSSFVSILQVSGDSMKGVFEDGQRILVLKPTFCNKIKEGDYVAAAILSRKKEKLVFVKQVIGCPGDKVVNYYANEDCSYIKIINSSNGHNKNYPPIIKTQGFCRNSSYSQTIRKLKNEYFLLGKNLDHSTDSRDFGPIKKQQLRGKVLFVF